MPTYDYECDACKYKFEVFQNIKEEPLKICPQCNKPKVKRIISGGVGTIFLVTGWTPKGNARGLGI